MGASRPDGPMGRSSSWARGSSHAVVARTQTAPGQQHLARPLHPVDDAGRPRSQSSGELRGELGSESGWRSENAPAGRERQRREGSDECGMGDARGYKAAIDDQLAEAITVLDAFHVVKLGTQAVDEVRRWVHQDTTGHRGRKDDSLYGIQRVLRAGAENLTDKQIDRLRGPRTRPTLPTKPST